MFETLRNQKAVLWAISSTKNGFGDYTFSSAVEIDVRWQDSNEMYTDEHGKEHISNSIVFPDRSITIGSYLHLGELEDLTTEQKANPKLVSSAFSVKKVYKSPTVNALDELVKVLL